MKNNTTGGSAGSFFTIPSLLSLSSRERHANSRFMSNALASNPRWRHPGWSFYREAKVLKVPLHRLVLLCSRIPPFLRPLPILRVIILQQALAQRITASFWAHRGQGTTRRGLPFFFFSKVQQ